jgi:ABC-type cobalamin/Fe3+-siderophores transport system ATPase subunit
MQVKLVTYAPIRKTQSIKTVVKFLMAQILHASIVESLAKHPSIPDEVRDYVADTAAGLVDDIHKLDANAIAAEMMDAISPLLEGCIPESTISDLCTKVAKAFKGISDDDTTASESPHSHPSKSEDYVVRCDGIILAYAGKSLLRSTCLQFKRGHCYGIVGNNGVGKTTLLTRIAAGDIGGFPQDICCVYVQHEILANDEHCVLEYMKDAQARLGESQHSVDIAAVLSEMGFTDALQQKLVLELSGGWRMRLALAGAIIRKADLLLLDEPTNHLDVDAVSWLVEYLRGLKQTTVLMVSHDYNFLSRASSDVVHFADHALTYYDSGWEQFAAARPDVIAALPTRKANSYFAELTG